ncbi:unannotated protein [freshwater metagenome]|uniref:Unannotated protein n=1 Tax=freshwater metagenome TaxID=449393 RepID=A0A6J6ASS1_9ZZZZ|nr:hypothetical protein [Actinomycetota bacterium]
MSLHSPLSGSVKSRFGGSGKARSKFFAFIAIGSAVPFLLSTFAASVTVGSGNLTFGQGSQQAVACDPQVFVAMGQEWKSAPTQTDSTNGFFRVKSVTVSNVDLVACQNTKLRIRLIDSTGKEIQLGGIQDATVLQMAIPSTDGQVSSSDPAVLGLGYLTGDGGVISGIMNAAISLSTVGTSVYDGSNLSANSADVTFYLDPTKNTVNIDGQNVGRVTVEAVNNPKPSS